MWDSPDEAFKELDKNEFKFFSGALSAYRDQLMREGFTRREALRLVESYSKFIYDMSLEEFATRREEEAFRDDVDPDDDNEL